MGVRIPRKKPRNLLLSALYRMDKLLPIGPERRLRLYLDLEWIFDRLALERSFDVYAEEDHPVRVHTRKFILERVHPTDSVLDLGCKNGYMSNYLAEKAAHVVGIDHDPEAISTARIQYQRGNLEFHEGDAVDLLKNRNMRFDVLILSHILEHIDDPGEFLACFKHHFLRIYIEVPDFDRYYLNHYRKDRGVKLIYSDIDHISEFDRYELRELLARAGLKIVQEEYRFGVQRIWCEHA